LTAPFHIALLRGVNVGGGKRVPMADLRELATRLGFLEPRTLLNSGNLVYRSPHMKPAEASKRLRAAIMDEMGVDTSVMVLTHDDLARILADNPMPTEALTNPSRFVVTVWSAGTTRAMLDPIANAPTTLERFVVRDHAAYLWFPDGISASTVYDKAARPLGDRITARNWNTMVKLHDMTAPAA
jgi:uncharacterized protein (DUF1697 family)